MSIVCLCFAVQVRLHRAAVMRDVRCVIDKDCREFDDVDFRTTVLSTRLPFFDTQVLLSLLLLRMPRDPLIGLVGKPSSGKSTTLNRCAMPLHPSFATVSKMCFMAA
jgi:hypothetical protein